MKLLVNYADVSYYYCLSYMIMYYHIERKINYFILFVYIAKKTHFAVIDGVLLHILILIHRCNPVLDL
jgi:hypothetical protein